MSYTYDLDGSLKARVGGQALAYDHDGVRVSMTAGGTTTHFLVDGNNPTGYGQVLEESGTQGGAPTRRYALGQDVVAQAAASVVRYLLYDGHGSTRLLTDAAGGLVTGARYDYDAFGNAVGFNAAAAATALLYCGEWFDAALGQYHLRARHYDQSAGRFTASSAAPATRSACTSSCARTTTLIEYIGARRADGASVLPPHHIRRFPTRGLRVDDG